jgi:hypothetical protein
MTISDLVLRQPSTAAGWVAEVRPHVRPWVRLDVELRDGSGALVLRFMGRTEIPGMEPGRRMHVAGTPARVRDELVMLNPIYSFLPCAHQ